MRWVWAKQLRLGMALKGKLMICICSPDWNGYSYSTGDSPEHLVLKVGITWPDWIRDVWLRRWYSWTSWWRPTPPNCIAPCSWQWFPSRCSKTGRGKLDRKKFCDSKRSWRIPLSLGAVSSDQDPGCLYYSTRLTCISSLSNQWNVTRAR